MCVDVNMIFHSNNNFMISSNYSKFISAKDETIIGITTPGQSESRSNRNEGVLYTMCSSIKQRDQTKPNQTRTKL